ncbi:mannose-1-phosphate guanylyltransferase/mannose-6-phosphate isomerase [Gluconacetobacter diazotrophicus PA1 5]|uniref:mannose-1-phosphate guanylyltransferase n=1 Tax=Gluconacetobacter diazotrophicus TaxID=33996 RepID=A0A7W4FE42_GLUDI|nr:mannose-1-phosphate guanylyltransferase/mannose-6-phosphate isomerase [Gluconacetobacter diazotrophicus]ACI50965.1 mannose-1-phosphate guanylyltransferase/mannose-6-phosphate isomerase [Gluconacetobacter diazotrophicus PA1 5]MBB2156101.1 mannose-1-phosphate guanylyltransferase/mannose-6-phosphate isomerase [Gluconacetobacter diazotrophicus]TWB08580.1 mannose-6-phosphate isomerase type 2 [Gluconacetobacter diazotrophicus]
MSDTTFPVIGTKAANTTRIVPVILSGGTGSRLWPLSRASYPKQLWSLVSEKTMLQETALRGCGEMFDAPIVICNNEHRFLIAEQLREAGIENARIVLEPAGRNSAPAIAAAALLAAETNPDAVLWIMAADAVITRPETLEHLMPAAAAAAQRGHIVVFGMHPTRPETGYGYIEAGKPLAKLPEANAVACFIEKPDAATAAELIASGKYMWNSGMFVFTARTLLKEMETYAPAVLNPVRQAVERRTSDLVFQRLDPQSFLSTPDISFDYAVMEHTDQAAVIAGDFGWTDIGSWDALWDISRKDDSGNVAEGQVFLESVHGSYVRSDEILTAVVGVDDVIVVATRDAVLVTQQSKAQDVKKIVTRLQAAGRQEAKAHNRCYRPWGFYESLIQDQRFQVKRIVVMPGEKLSLQKHYHRAEHWIVVSGVALVTRNAELITVHENESIYLPQECTHRMENPGKIPLVLIEIQTGSYLGEDDIIRFEDNYNRS